MQFEWRRFEELSAGELYDDGGIPHYHMRLGARLS